MVGLLRDVTYSLRQLRRTPGFTAVAMISLALGIGAGTSVFSLANAILLRSLPVPNPQELRVLRWTASETRIPTFAGATFTGGPAGQSGNVFGHPVFVALRENCSDAAAVFGFRLLRSVTVRSRHEAFVADGLMVSDNFFSALGIRPLLGRLLSSEDSQAGAAPATVVTHAWWQRHLGGALDVLGHSVLYGGQDFTVVGVLPPEFRGVRPALEIGFYVPMSAQPELSPATPLTSRDVWWVQAMARLRPGVDDARLQAAADVTLAQQAGALMDAPSVLVENGRGGPSRERDRYRRPLLLLSGIVGVVLLVACANLAGLSLARNTARHHEFSVRAAVGASRWRLIRQSLTESTVLALLGGAVGVWLALWGRVALLQLLDNSPRGLHYDTSLDAVVLGVALVTALGTALLSGLLPALRVSRVGSFLALKGHTMLGLPRQRLGRVLVSAQIALSMLLLAGAGLYVRTLVNLARIDPGFATEQLLLFRVTAADAGYEGARSVALYDEILRSLAVIPGVRSATLMQFPLLSGTASNGPFFTLPGRPTEGLPTPRAHRLTVSETFFATMGIPLQLGRGLRASDAAEAARVVVVNEAFARKYLAGEHPIGQTLRAQDEDWQIVGVCRDAKYADIKKEAPPTVYFSFRQHFLPSTAVAVRAAVEPLALVPAVRQAVAAIDPDLPLARIRTQEQIRARGVSHERLFAYLCGGLAVLAVFLSCVGLFGLMAYRVARRRNEIGVRKALGASGRQISGPILREALMLAGIGVGIGVPLALALVGLIENQLHGVAPFDPSTLVGGVLLMVSLAMGAAWWPARRASRIDPMEALRCD